MSTSDRAAGLPAHDIDRVPYDVERVRADFPILSRLVHDKRLVYLDNAASTQKPRQVIERIKRFYETEYSNVHRGVHHLSQLATSAYEDARERLRAFVDAENAREIVFVRGATEAINLVAQSFARPRLSSGEEILISGMEHHANIVPWQILREQTGAQLRVVPVTDDGELDLEAFERRLGPRTALVALIHTSNALGTINPVRDLVRLAHAQGVPVLVDGAQAVAHQRVSVRELGCDFFAFSAHKMYGPSGIGALYARGELLEAMPPYQAGGEMIRSVTFERTIYNDIPHRFEAGTPNIAGAVGFAAAIDYLEQLGLERVAAWESALLAQATEALSGVSGLRIVGTARAKAPVISMTIDGVHPHDVATVLDSEGIAVRAGHHCAQPLMDRFGVPATTRASFALYNTREEIDMLVAGLQRVREVFG
ncbi:MAG: cysteine desulfurase [Acidobacteriota bacterium]|nr:MAG: cysteine desulfurase [Acidobacteriota bacterium]